MAQIQKPTTRRALQAALEQAQLNMKACNPDPTGKHPQYSQAQWYAYWHGVVMAFRLILGVIKYLYYPTAFDEIWAGTRGSEPDGRGFK